MTIQIRKHLVSSSIASKVTSGKGNTRKKICIHETDNTNKGANANAHARLQANGNSRQASWHYQVDDKEIVQSFTHDWRCWAAGNAKGNNEAIHIEICVNSDGNYKKAVENTAKLVAKILKDEKLTINDVVQHNFYSGKHCPRHMRESSKGVTWSQFIQMVKNELNNNEKSDLTMSQYNEIMKELNALKQELANKADKEIHFDAPEWSKESVDWAYSIGLLKGNGKGLNLGGALSRQELFVILKRYHDKYVKK